MRQCNVIRCGAVAQTQTKMTYKDLRFGNWVKGHLTGQYLQVYWLVMKHMEDGNIQSVYTPDIPVYEPIPITEDLLIKLGFEEVYKSPIHSTYFLDGLSYYFWYNDGRQYADFKGVQINCNYLHSMQNLHHSLTGKELELNLLITPQSAP